MNNLEKNNYNILRSFNEKCEKLNIWYSLSNSSLLNYKTNNDFLGNNEIIEIMMPVEDYNKFLHHNYENIIDNLTKNNYFYTNPFYFENDSSIIIKINLLIKSSIKKTEKCYSIKNLIRQKISYFRSKKSISNFFEFIKKSWYEFWNIFYSPLTWHEISSNIYDEDFNGYFLVDSFSQNINRNWIPSLTKRTEKVEWNGINTYILKEWDIYLCKKYGNDWRTNPILKRDIDFKFIYSDFIMH
ncbi:MAG: hypothetical protein HDR43_01825 [Mycoplasma sp.]|nr:hypothetical protein [Mycoplasma sp.]